MSRSYATERFFYALIVMIGRRTLPHAPAVIHAMAISDFSFKPITTKLKSNDPGAFINSLRDRITVSPKVISYIKKWNPDVTLVSFKFEVDQTTEQLINNTSDVINNDIFIFFINNEYLLKFAKLFILSNSYLTIN